MQEIIQTINNSKNIYLIPSESHEAITSTLALFYTLKELGKNVNLVIDNIPESINFLSPSLDFISYPKNFVISVPNKIAGISQIHYEKNEEALKIYLTIERGNIKKDNISFYYSETKPDLIITIGVQDYTKQLTDKLNSFGFLLDSPIINIDNKQDNKKFGRINIVETKSLAQISYSIINNIKEELITKESANCLLAGIVSYTENFKNNLDADIFEITGFLMKKGADLKKVSENIK